MNPASVISEHLLQIRVMSTSGEIALRRMLQSGFDDNATLVQVITNGLVLSGN